MNIQKTTLGGGCFWCLEAVFLRVPGVVRVVSGYAGGHTNNPTYKEICTGNSGHAEVVEVEFNTQVIDYSGILKIFWLCHDPTTLNRQGNDVGTQYRSVLFTHDPEQEKIAIQSREEAQKNFTDPIVTQIAPIPTFFPAEDYHQNYFALNPGNPYCRFVIVPKVQKLEKHLLN